MRDWHGAVSKQTCLGCNQPLDGTVNYTKVLEAADWQGIPLDNELVIDACTECRPILINAITILYERGLLG